MVIKKVFNNNVILTEDKGQEVVAMGRGLAFQKRVGDMVDDDKVDKIYTLSSPDLQDGFQKLLADLPEEYLGIAGEIVSMAEEELGKLNERTYISLTDHIHTAVERIKEGCALKNLMSWEIKRFYPKEYAVALKAVALMSERLGVNIPEDEAGFITLHFIDGQADMRQPMADKVLKFIQDLAEIVRLTCAVDFDRDSIAYYRFITHLKFFARRVFSGQKGKNEIDDDVAEMVKKKYAVANQAVDRIAEFLAKTYDYKLNRDERFYLTIHIKKAVSEARSKDDI